MSLSTAVVARFLFELALLVVAAHSLGSLFARLRQPRVIGEIAGGLLLGPTVLGALLPGLQRSLFPTSGTGASLIGVIDELGLLLLLFCAGTQIRASFRRGDARTVVGVFTAGMALPFAAGAALVALVPERRFWGPHGDHTAFLLVFAVSLAVTSIPVISKIMLDLGLMGTRFARLVLGVAVMEDVLLYVVLAVALGVVSRPQGALFGVPAAWHLRPGSGGDLAYYCLVTVGFLTVTLVFGPALFRRFLRSRLNLVNRYSPLASQLVLMLLGCLVAAYLGIEVFFGAFVAGVVVGRASCSPDAVPPSQVVHDVETSGAIDAIQRFAFGFFVPVYFAVVGLSLNLRTGFPAAFFAGFLLAACLVKGASVYLGARASGEPPRGSWHLAVAMNARGGPGIVVATTAYAAGIVDQGFYAVLVLLSIITSLGAGAWLQRVPPQELADPPAAGAPALAGRGRHR